MEHNGEVRRTESGKVLGDIESPHVSDFCVWCIIFSAILVITVSLPMVVKLIYLGVHKSFFEFSFFKLYSFCSSDKFCLFFDVASNVVGTVVPIFSLIFSLYVLISKKLSSKRKVEE